MKPKLVADYNCVIGEGPLWHPAEKRLYWVDIETGRVFRYDPASGKHEQVLQDGVIGGFTIQADGSLLLFMAKGTVKIWRKGKLSIVIEHIPDEEESRFNDVIADPEGRVFCGTMSTASRPGRLYRLDTDGTLSQVLKGIKGSNGMAFTPDRKCMYYTDSLKHEIYLFDFDRSTGGLTNQRVFARNSPAEGEPDGLTVDAEGFVWSARWGGGCLVRFTPDGKEDRRIRFPAKKVSCMTFGGEGYRDMYVTTAGGNNKKDEGTGAGALFRLDAGVRGVPEFLSKIGLIP